MSVFSKSEPCRINSQTTSSLLGFSIGLIGLKTNFLIRDGLKIASENSLDFAPAITACKSVYIVFLASIKRLRSSQSRLDEMNSQSLISSMLHGL